LREILSFFFGEITDPLSLPLSPFAEWIILLIIHEIAYELAFSIVGDLYHSGCIRGRSSGSFSHWGFRTIIFLVIWGGINVLIFTYKFVIEHWLMIIGIIGSILVAVGLVFIYVESRRDTRE
jgi:hypothetical protein